MVLVGMPGSKTEGAQAFNYAVRREQKCHWTTMIGSRLSPNGRCGDGWSLDYPVTFAPECQKVNFDERTSGLHLV